MNIHYGRFLYHENHLVRIVKLPLACDSDDLDMIIILPKSRFHLNDVVRYLEGKDLIILVRTAIPNHMEVRFVRVPEFQIEQTMEMKELLSERYLTETFTTDANFTNYFFHSVPISQIIYKGSIEVSDTIIF
ncbi:unnamed protein product [Thelazia callipaeda]|uniref:SERPIN domain-containing protein n=1 Tax=Thelazia callipaeda TaxID=103827 RepID=A0A0N5DBF2_THECL|nr:unnamed protein product [Thelazia callipaeda]